MNTPCDKLVVQSSSPPPPPVGRARGRGGQPGCDNDGSRFWIAVIPQTWITTTLQYRQVGDVVNLEVDLFAKYTERLLYFHGQAGHSQSLGPKPGTAGEALPSHPISAPWLRSQGW